VRRQNESSFGCEAVARALGLQNVPECAVGFHLFFVFMQQKFLCLFVVCFVFLQ
jgi:hypothetical protein